MVDFSGTKLLPLHTQLSQIETKIEQDDNKLITINILLIINSTFKHFLPISTRFNRY